MIEVEGVVSVRDEKALLVLHDLQVPVRESASQCLPGELRASDRHDVGESHIGSVHGGRLVLGQLGEEGVLQGGDGLQVAAIRELLEKNGLLGVDGVEGVLEGVVATALGAGDEEGKEELQGGGGGDFLCGHLSKIAEFNLIHRLPSGFDLDEREKGVVQEWRECGENRNYDADTE